MKKIPILCALVALEIAIIPQLYGAVDATLQVGKFVTTLPRLTRDVIQEFFLIENTLGPLIKQAESLKKSFSPTEPDGLPKLFDQSLNAYARKDYENVGFTKIGLGLEKNIPLIMSLILQSYPLIKFSTEQLGKPILSLTSNIATVVNNTPIKSFSDDLLTILNTGLIPEVFALFNELDTILSDDLLPRITDLFVEIDRILPQVAALKLIK